MGHGIGSLEKSVVARAAKDLAARVATVMTVARAVTVMTVARVASGSRVVIARIADRVATVMTVARVATVMTVARVATVMTVARVATVTMFHKPKHSAVALRYSPAKVRASTAKTSRSVIAQIAKSASSMKVPCVNQGLRAPSVLHAMHHVVSHVRRAVKTDRCIQRRQRYKNHWPVKFAVQ
jgi:hypothetical protein